MMEFPKWVALDASHMIEKPRRDDTPYQRAFAPWVLELPIFIERDATVRVMVNNEDGERRATSQARA
jgi:hypothetical protein